MSLAQIKAQLEQWADPVQARQLQKFFKTAPGQYGHGDIFLGIKVPPLRRLAKQQLNLALTDIAKLLRCNIHEQRMLALLILTDQYGRADELSKEAIYRFYLAHTPWINNWDLVDVTAPHIVGAHLMARDKSPLLTLARSASIWERRIAIVATAFFIRRGCFDDTLAIAALLIGDGHDLIHKAVGWMLREVGKRNQSVLERFLGAHYRQMPRTMLRYAIERLPEPRRLDYLKNRGVQSAEQAAGSTARRGPEPARISVHGGHSGQFCCHAQDRLEAVVQAYIARDFDWVGLTEHMPPVADRFLYPEELQAGLSAAAMAERFGHFMAEARRLQAVYAGRIDLRVGFETESTTGAMALARRLTNTYAPDYIVGSIHHVADIAFDYNLAEYRRAVEAAGGLPALYCRYFDDQYALLQELAPRVAAHFDLIRIFDPDYPAHLALPAVRNRIRRNLELIRDSNMLLELNVAAFRKGAGEPYPSRPILHLAHEMGIGMVPADDSHGVATVGAFIDEGIRILREVGFDTQWTKPCP